MCQQGGEESERGIGDGGPGPHAVSSLYLRPHPLFLQVKKTLFNSEEHSPGCLSSFLAVVLPADVLLFFFVFSPFKFFDVRYCWEDRSFPGRAR